MRVQLVLVSVPRLPLQGIRSMSPGPDFRGADRERCVSYFTLLWWSKNTLSAMAGRRKRPVRCSRKLRQEGQDVEGICRAKMATCQNNFRNGYSGLPAFGLDRLRDNYVIDIEIALIAASSRARKCSELCLLRIGAEIPRTGRRSSDL